MNAPSRRPASLDGIMEASVYCRDLDAASRFYTAVLGLEPVDRDEDHYVFLRCAHTMLLIFDPDVSRKKCAVIGGGHIPPHGSTGAGHLAFQSRLRDLF